MFESIQLGPKQIKTYIATDTGPLGFISWVSPEQSIKSGTVYFTPKSNPFINAGMHSGTLVYEYNKLYSLELGRNITSNQYKYHPQQRAYFYSDIQQYSDKLVHIEGQYTELNQTQDAYRRVQWRMSFVDTGKTLDKQKLNIQRDIGSWWIIPATKQKNRI